MKKIILTGGGTAGHVTPNVALLPTLRERGFSISYVGTRTGIEFNLISRENIPFFPICAGKLRRYFDLKNISDLFRIAIGFLQAIVIIIRLQPNIVFSKGGFVSCPVVWAAWLFRIPVVIHESDITPGLANRLSLPFAKKICYSFPETARHVAKNKGMYTGLPVRTTLLGGNKDEGIKICGFTNEKPVIMIMGGSQGSVVVNGAVREALPELQNDFNLCHICGKGNLTADAQNAYKQFEYVTDELPHLFAATDLFIGRSGATTLFELLALKKASLLIPLASGASRGDQILNARSFKKQGFSEMLLQENLNASTLVEYCKKTYEKRLDMIHAIELSNVPNGVSSVVEVLESI